jgi:hypothetical protein
MASFEKFEAKVRSAPLQSAGLGLAAAWLVTRLPVFGILGLLARVALALLKPALLVLGGVRVLDLIQARRAETSQALPENHF